MCADYFGIGSYYLCFGAVALNTLVCTKRSCFTSRKGNFEKILNFLLQNPDGHGIIIKRDCTRRFLEAPRKVSSEAFRGWKRERQICDEAGGCGPQRAGFSVEYVRFQTGRRNLKSRNHREAPGRPSVCPSKDVMGFSHSRNPYADFGFLMPWVGTPGAV